MTAYHDAEWGVPTHDDRRHFEFLILEGAQAGLSWLSVLSRREAYRRAFCDFDPVAVAQMTPEDVERLLVDSGIIRNRKKVESAISNARAFLAVQAEHGTFDEFVWGFVGGTTIVNVRNDIDQLPAETEESQRLSAELRRRGFRFVGPIVCYSHMQACGLVMDHLTSCYRFAELSL